ncbi:unnamed protein product [Microthlaspi erraticum]|uniref:F-box domain-containing protein n=1 Tax=Microthlaspi erraticum TaxID=1685480 RepID=A0A6D2JKR2_9BRAS|nr:unnamed protein product [Microthlaspi erraticum]
MAMDSKECSLMLPFELCEEILCRVPTKSLIRFKSTCKRWLALFKDKRFIYKHLALIQEQLVRINHYNFTIINPVLGVCSSLTSLPSEFHARPEIYTMIHCDGLFLCILQSSAMAVWNPCLRQVRWIKPEFSHRAYCSYGIGYDDGLSSRDSGYKIMRFVHSFSNKSEIGSLGPYNKEVDIYELNSNSWKTLRVSSLDYCWHVVDRCRAFRGDGLSLLHKGKEKDNIEVWVTNKIKNGVIIAWTKFFNVVMRPDLPDCEELLEDEENVRVINTYVIGDGEVRKQEIDRFRVGCSWPYVSGYACLPSLVPVPTLEDKTE